MTCYVFFLPTLVKYLCYRAGHISFLNCTVFSMFFRALVIYFAILLCSIAAAKQPIFLICQSVYPNYYIVPYAYVKVTQNFLTCNINAQLESSI